MTHTEDMNERQVAADQPRRPGTQRTTQDDAYAAPPEAPSLAEAIRSIQTGRDDRIRRWLDVESGVVGEGPSDQEILIVDDLPESDRAEERTASPVPPVWRFQSEAVNAEPTFFTPIDPPVEDDSSEDGDDVRGTDLLAEASRAYERAVFPRRFLQGTD